MSRPKCHRNICGIPDKNYFKPRGIPTVDLEEIVLNLDEFEAIRLADYEQLYQEEAAAKKPPLFFQTVESLWSGRRKK